MKYSVINVFTCPKGCPTVLVGQKFYITCREKKTWQGMWSSAKMNPAVKGSMTSLVTYDASKNNMLK